MNAPIDQKRRQVLHRLACLSALGVPFIRRAMAHNESSDEHATQLVRIFSHRESARHVGEAYLRIYPQEANADLLVRLICSPKLNSKLAFSETSEQALKVLVQRQQREDFELEQVINLQGWVLSKTEARLCALSALV